MLPRDSLVRKLRDRTIEDKVKTLTINELIPHSIRFVCGLSEPQRRISVRRRYGLQPDFLMVIEGSCQNGS